MISLKANKNLVVFAITIPSSSLFVFELFVLCIALYLVFQCRKGKKDKLKSFKFPKKVNHKKTKTKRTASVVNVRKQIA